MFCHQSRVHLLAFRSQSRGKGNILDQIHKKKNVRIPSNFKLAEITGSAVTYMYKISKVVINGSILITRLEVQVER